MEGIDINQHLFLKDLTDDVIDEQALRFAECSRAVPIQPDSSELIGANIGERIERLFREFIVTNGYDPDKANGKKGAADFTSIHTDLKCLRVDGLRGGSAKFHGYSCDGNPPTYDLLVFGYSLRDDGVRIMQVYRVNAEHVHWVQAKHFLFSIPDKKLLRYELT